MRPHREPGIRRDASGKIQAHVRAGGQLRFKPFPAGTSLETVRRWRLDTRASLGLLQRPSGTLAADIEPFLRQIADRPRLVAERRQQLEWWAAGLGHLRRDAIPPGDVRAALADLRRTHAASTCNHYRQALFSLYRALDGCDAPNPVRDVKPFTSPAPKAPGLSYDVVGRILAAMSDQGSATVRGKPRAAASAAKVRCRVLAFTGLRPSELMRYRPSTGTGRRRRSWCTRGRVVARGLFRSVRPPSKRWPISKPWPRSVRSRPLPSDGRSSRAAARLGIHGVRPYDLRHSYGTALYRAAGDTRLVKDVLGHSDTRMTEQYTLGHVPEAMRMATSRFEEHLGTTGAPLTAPKRAATGTPR